MSTRQALSPKAPKQRNARVRVNAPEVSIAHAPSDDAPVNNGTRGRILSAAERLFAERGFADVSMPAIAAASGITAGAIYKHFASKDDLFFEIVRRAVQAAPTPIAEAGDASGAARLARIVGNYTTHDLKRVRQLAVEIHYASTKHPRVCRLLRDSVDRNIRQIADGVENAQRLGAGDPALDPELLASAVMAFIMGLMHMETLLPKLAGDIRWRDFVQGRVLALIGARQFAKNVSSGSDNQEDRGT
jgi:AcrR family transcriptional regulator